MTNWLIALRDGAASLGLTVTAEQESLFARFHALLLERNEQINLTAIIDPVEVAVKHFVDSLTVELVWTPRDGDRALDIGTGAGFPGVPLAIRHPATDFILNDSIRKKTDFLQEATELLGLHNAHPVWARAEVLGREPDYRARQQAVLVRAVAHLGTLVEYALPLLAMGGILVAMKGPSGVKEAEESRRVLAEIGGEITEIRRLTLAGAGERQLVVVRKTRSTPETFPREPGLAKKHPLYQRAE